jgi:hypothetical protein
LTTIVRGILAVIAGVVAAFVAILLVEALGALAAPAGPAPALTDDAAMRAYLASLPWSAYAFVVAAYLVGSAIGGVVALKIVGDGASRTVWVTGALILAATVANLVMIPHPLWFTAASVGAVFVGTALARMVVSSGPAVAA